MLTGYLWILYNVLSLDTEGFPLSSAIAKFYNQDQLLVEIFAGSSYCQHSTLIHIEMRCGDRLGSDVTQQLFLQHANLRSVDKSFLV